MLVQNLRRSKKSSANLRSRIGAGSGPGAASPLTPLLVSAIGLKVNNELDGAPEGALVGYAVVGAFVGALMGSLEVLRSWVLCKWILLGIFLRTLLDFRACYN